MEPIGPGRRTHDLDPLAGWSATQHAQGMCEAWVQRPGRRGYPCRSRASREVWTTGTSRPMVLHLCGTHALPWVRIRAHQVAGLNWRPGWPLPHDAELHWRHL